MTASVSQGRQARAQLTLREQQVLQLRKEMSHPAGVRLKLGRRDCKDGIAFVDCFGAVWFVLDFFSSSPCSKYSDGFYIRYFYYY
jgi:hypothetical protein